MERRHEELERLKQMVNLPVLAARYGFKKHPGKSTRHTLSLTDDHGQHLVVSINPGSGHWQWFDPVNPACAGTVIDFVQMMEQVSLGEVRKLLRGCLNTLNTTPLECAQRPVPAHKDRRAVAACLTRMAPLTSPTTYALARGLASSTLRAPVFQGRVLRGFNQAMVFPHWDANGVCGYEIKAAGFTSFCSRGYKSLWVSRLPKQMTQVVVVESGIEALSYYQRYPQGHACFVSTAGNWSKAVDERLGTLMQFHATATIIGAFGHDAGGERHAQRLAQLALQAGCRYQRHCPPLPGTDWNDMLKADNGEAKKS